MLIIKYTITQCKIKNVQLRFSSCTFHFLVGQLEISRKHGSRCFWLIALVETGATDSRRETSNELTSLVKFSAGFVTIGKHELQFCCRLWCCVPEFPVVPTRCQHTKICLHVESSGPRLTVNSV